MSLPPPPLEPQPVSVEALSYFTPSGPPRPGILVAVGIISIIVSLLSILSGCSGVFQAFVMRSLPMAIPVPATLPGPGVTPSVAVVNLANMTAAERQKVVIGLNSRQTLSATQLEMLDMLLSQCGDSVVPFSGENITQQSVAGNVASAGTLTAADGTGGVYFILANGRIDVSDNDASFSPLGNVPSVRINRPPPTGGTGASPTSGTVNSRMTFAMTTGLANGPFIFEGIMSALSMILAIVLLTAAILTLQQRRSGRKLHLIYGWIKIPLACVAAYASALMTMEYLKSLSPAMGTTLPPVVLAVQVIFSAIIGCVYPVALIIIMNLKSVRTYFQNQTAK